MTGKLADVVMAVRNGEQVARKYQPIVANPSTPAQIETRAKLKLMSQLSAVMAPVIAMRREGNKSSRNLFVQANYGALTYAENQADIVLANVKITKSVVGLPGISAYRDTSNIVAVLESADPHLNVSRVVYAAFEKQADGSLRYIGSAVSTEAGSGGGWGVSFPSTPNEVVVYAYGVRDNTEAATAKFGNMQTVTAETVAKLIVTSTLTEADVTLTETRSSTVSASTQANHSSLEDSGSRNTTKRK